MWLQTAVNVHGWCQNAHLDIDRRGSIHLWKVNGHADGQNAEQRSVSVWPILKSSVTPKIKSVTPATDRKRDPKLYVSNSLLGKDHLGAHEGETERRLVPPTARVSCLVSYCLPRNSNTRIEDNLGAKMALYYLRLPFAAVNYLAEQENDAIAGKRVTREDARRSR